MYIYEFLSLKNSVIWIASLFYFFILISSLHAVCLYLTKYFFFFKDSLKLSCLVRYPLFIFWTLSSSWSIVSNSFSVIFFISCSFASIFFYYWPLKSVSRWSTLKESWSVDSSLKDFSIEFFSWPVLWNYVLNTCSSFKFDKAARPCSKSWFGFFGSNKNLIFYCNLFLIISDKSNTDTIINPCPWMYIFSSCFLCCQYITVLCKE